LWLEQVRGSCGQRLCESAGCYHVSLSVCCISPCISGEQATRVDPGLQQRQTVGSRRMAGEGVSSKLAFLYRVYDAWPCQRVGARQPESSFSLSREERALQSALSECTIQPSSGVSTLTCAKALPPCSCLHLVVPKTSLLGNTPHQRGWMFSRVLSIGNCLCTCLSTQQAPQACSARMSRAGEVCTATATAWSSY
jgi:hypothetical protein